MRMALVLPLVSVGVGVLLVGMYRGVELHHGTKQTDRPWKLACLLS